MSCSRLHKCSHPQPLDLKSSTLLLSHCAPQYNVHLIQSSAQGVFDQDTLSSLLSKECPDMTKILLTGTLNISSNKAMYKYNVHLIQMMDSKYRIIIANLQ